MGERSDQWASDLRAYVTSSNAMLDAAPVADVLRAVSERAGQLIALQYRLQERRADGRVADHREPGGVGGLPAAAFCGPPPTLSHAGVAIWCL